MIEKIRSDKLKDPNLMLCLDFSMNIVSVVGWRLGSSSQSSGSLSEMCCRFPEDSILFELSTCNIITTF
jgi:hypothetical protein